MKKTQKFSYRLSVKEKRFKCTGPILERIHYKVVMMMLDEKIIANELMGSQKLFEISAAPSLRIFIRDYISLAYS